MTFPKTLFPGFYDSSLSLIAASFYLLFVIYKLKIMSYDLIFDEPARRMRQSLIFYANACKLPLQRYARCQQSLCSSLE